MNSSIDYDIFVYAKQYFTTDCGSEVLYRVMCTDELMDIVEEGDWREFVPVDEDLGQSTVDPKTGKNVDFDPKQTSNYKYFKSFTRTLSKQLFDWFIEGGKDVVVVAFNKEGLKRLRNCQLRPFTIHQYSQSIKAKDNEFEERLYSKTSRWKYRMSMI